MGLPVGRHPVPERGFIDLKLPSDRATTLDHKLHSISLISLELLSELTTLRSPCRHISDSNFPGNNYPQKLSHPNTIKTPLLAYNPLLPQVEGYSPLF